MAEVKGVLVKAQREFLVERYGKDSMERSTATLDPDDAALVQRKFLDSSFYPYKTIIALGRLARALASHGRSTPEEMGAFIAAFVFKGVYKPLVAPSPAAMVAKMSWITEFFYRDTQKIESAMNGDKSCVVTYRYEGEVRPTRAVCRSNAGFWRRTLEMAGAPHVQGAHPVCLVDGGDRCEFRFSW